VCVSRRVKFLYDAEQHTTHAHSSFRIQLDGADYSEPVELLMRNLVWRWEVDVLTHRSVWTVGSIACTRTVTSVNQYYCHLSDND
jgi:hypothetical protein